MALGDVPGFSRELQGHLKDSCLGVREDMVVLLNWRTYMPSRLSGFLSGSVSLGGDKYLAVFVLCVSTV